MRLYRNKYSYILVATILILVLQICVFENRLSLYIHLKDCNYPWGIENVEIEKKRIPFTDDIAIASFTLKKNKIKDWLIDSNFEVLIFKDGDEMIFISKKKNIPLSIQEGEVGFVIQFLHHNNERTSVRVDCHKDSASAFVSLIYNPT